MIDSPTTFRAIIDLWSSRPAAAEAIGATPSQLSKWWQRDRIPSEWWTELLAAPPVIAAGLTAADLAEMAARSRKGAAR
ncbi:hypothetical protein CKO39_18210 [Rhodopseudomonas palustris]|nr:hypothetical protein CKO39_18210 [Rhodopseudomonas palustris]